MCEDDLESKFTFTSYVTVIDRQQGYSESYQTSKMVEEGAFSNNQLQPRTISERHYKIFYRDVSTVELLNIPEF